MALYLTELASWLRSAGLPVLEYPGWQTRARSSGGYSDYPLCVMWHHTASPQSWDGQKDADYCAVGDPDAPVSNLYIDRSGTVWVLAAGATNTNGKGRSITFSRGTVPADSMNTRAVGMEMGNDGVGEQWTEAQVNSAFIVSNMINAKMGNQPSDLCTHQNYAPDRKIDPATCNVAGPWVPVSCSSAGSWSVESIVAEANARAWGSLPVPPDNGDDDMAYPCEGLWTLNDTGVVVAIYSGGYKVWLPNPEALLAKQNLISLHGVNPEIRTQTDENMFRAFGPILGPYPSGYDDYGVPL